MQWLIPASLVLIMTTFSAQASIYDDCLLRNMPNARTDYAAKSINEVCVRTSEQELSLDLIPKLILDASYKGGGIGVVIHVNNQTGHAVTEIRFRFINKITNQAGLTYSLKTFYGGAIFPMILPDGQITTFSRQVNERPLAGKSFFDTYTWQIVRLKGW